MTWHASLLQSIVEQNDHPDMIIARRMSDLDQTQWQHQRRQKHFEAKQQIKDGKFLAKQRDCGKIKFEDMSATEQQLLEDFDYEKLQQRHENLRVQEPERCSKML